MLLLTTTYLPGGYKQRGSAIHQGRQWAALLFPEPSFPVSLNGSVWQKSHQEGFSILKAISSCMYLLLLFFGFSYLKQKIEEDKALGCGDRHSTLLPAAWGMVGGWGVGVKPGLQGEQGVHLHQRRGGWAGLGVVLPLLPSASAHTCAHGFVCFSWDCLAPLPIQKSSFSPWSGWSLLSGFSPFLLPSLPLFFPCSPPLPFHSLISVAQAWDPSSASSSAWIPSSPPGTAPFLV